jgi:hypothetical protein
VRQIVKVLLVAFTTTPWTVIVPLGLAWSVATTADVEARSMPGVTMTLDFPAPIVAIPTELSNLTRPTVRRAVPLFALAVVT